MSHTHIKRGQVYFIGPDDEKPPFGHEIWPNRPGLIVSNDTINKHSSTVEIVYLTTQKSNRKGFLGLLSVPVTTNDTESIAMCEQIHTVDIRRLQSIMGEIDSTQMRDVDAALALSLGNSDTHIASYFLKWENYIKTYAIPVGENQLEEALCDDDIEVIASLKRKLRQVTIERDSYKNLCDVYREQVEHE